TVPAGTLPLPRDLDDFTARGAALARIGALAEATGAACPPLALVTGQPGLGKTAFATRAAHVLAPHYPDGRLALDLRGMDEQPLAPRDALARLLRAVGVADSAVPHGTQDRSGLFRSIAAERRLLLLLDNAAAEEQIRPLLPGGGASLTIVTSRHALTGLEAAQRIDLALLDAGESAELLARIIGPARVERERQAADDLARLCGYLPLAVRICGQRLAARTQEHLGKLVAELTGEERRLDALQAGSLRVRAAFALSYRQLTPPARTLLRRGALAAGADFSPESAALLSGVGVREARLCARELADHGLLEPHPVLERYRFHDLLRLFAAEQADTDDGAGVLEAALDRTARWMLARARGAALHFHAEQDRVSAGDPATGPDPDPATAPVGRQQAHAWLEGERSQWLWAFRRALAAGWHREVVDTAQAMHWFSDRTEHWEQWVEVFRCSADAARALGSRREEAVHLNFLAWAYNRCVHDHRRALEAATAALAIAHRCGDRLQVGWALGYGASALKHLGRVEEALAWLTDCAACHRANPAPEGRIAELTALNTLGAHLRDLGRVEEALTIHRHGEVIYRERLAGCSPDLVAVLRAVTLQHLGNDLAALGRWGEAEPLLGESLAAFEGAGMLAWSEPVRLDLGITLRCLGRHDEARAQLLAAERSLTELNNPRRRDATAELRTLDDARTGRPGGPSGPRASLLPARDHR
ncbi:tetratricopeptide repeat protein, partial [Streptomyces sp. CBMA156]|uniref:tetratricopeptide repeat protein n=1 Tax=Streptomyces sp. CBMA156 TaxID=1930280 RepID=UPI0016621AED